MQRRQALREKLKLDQYDSSADAPDKQWQDSPNDQAKPSQVSVHDLGHLTSVVTVEPLALNDDRYVESDAGASALSGTKQLDWLTMYAAARCNDSNKNAPSAMSHVWNK